MKVTPNKDAESIKDGWLDFGNEYLVLFIQTFSDGRQEYLIWSEKQSGVALFPISEFRIIDHSISDNWIISLDWNGCLIAGPEKWMAPDFWDQYNNDSPNAIALFEEERQRMMRECRTDKGSNIDIGHEEGQ